MFSALSWLLEPSPTHAHDAQDTDARMEHRWQAEASPDTESLPRHFSAEWDEMHEGDEPVDDAASEEEFRMQPRPEPHARHRDHVEQQHGDVRRRGAQQWVARGGEEEGARGGGEGEEEVEGASHSCTPAQPLPRVSSAEERHSETLVREAHPARERVCK